MGSETWGCDKPQKGEDAGSLQGGSDKAEKSCGEQGGFKQDWPEHIIFILPVV